MNNKMKRAYVLFGRLLLVVCMAVCFAEAAFAGMTQPDRIEEIG